MNKKQKLKFKGINITADAYADVNRQNPNSFHRHYKYMVVVRLRSEGNSISDKI